MSLYDDLNLVISGGFCVGCGVCATVAPEAVEIFRNGDGSCEARIVSPSELKEMNVGLCPFSDTSPDEDEHASKLFKDNPFSNPYLGRFISTWAGHVEENGFREKGSSGGLTSWILAEALRLGHVDAVVHVHATDGSADDLFVYSIARSVNAVLTGAKTRYYSVSMNDVLGEVLDAGLRIALVGVPCFIKAARNLADTDAKFSDCLVMAVSLVCGHMKSAGFAESLAWQLGIVPSDIKTVDFRVKRSGLPASQYGFSAISRKRQETRGAPMGDMAGRRWDGGYFRLKACDFCDDVVGETADVSLGDAWLPEFSRHSEGTNVVVVRSKKVAGLLAGGIKNGRLALRFLAPERVIASQAGGFRDRREALAYRLYLADRSAEWRPTKRVEPRCNHLTFMRKVTYRLRQIVSRRSFASMRLSRQVGGIFPYRWEMTFWHGILRLLGILESMLRRLNGPR